MREREGEKKNQRERERGSSLRIFLFQSEKFIDQTTCHECSLNFYDRKKSFNYHQSSLFLSGLQRERERERSVVNINFHTL